MRRWKVYELIQALFMHCCNTFILATLFNHLSNVGEWAMFQKTNHWFGLLIFGRRLVWLARGGLLAALALFALFLTMEATATAGTIIMKGGCLFRQPSQSLHKWFA